MSTSRPVLSRFTLHMSAVEWGDQTEEAYFNCGLSSVFDFKSWLCTLIVRLRKPMVEVDLPFNIICVYSESKVIRLCDP